MDKLSKDFWTQRYESQKTGWDIGYPSTPIKEYIDQLEDKTIKVLIPGAGNAYEGEYLWKNGFTNVFILDISEKPLELFQERVPDFPSNQLICADFFDLKTKFDLVVEQTFFCALDPKLRTDYAKKMSEILSPKGKIVGLLFDFPLTAEGPPFGGCKNEYLETFSSFFEIIVMERSYNSIKPRQGRELFVNMVIKG